MISPTYKNTVTGFKTDSKDNVLFMESNSNGSRKSPILNAIVNGKSVNNRLNFLANNNRTDEYGSIAGGIYRLVKKFVQFPEVQIILEMRQKL